MDLIIGQQISQYFLRKATYNLKFGVYWLLSILLQGGVFKVPGSCLVCWSTEKEDLADSDRVAAVAD